MTRRAAIFVLVAAIAVAAFVVLRPDAGGAVAAAQRVLRNDKRFVNGPTAAQTFAKLSEDMLGDAKRCAHHHSRRDSRCRARYSSAAYTSVTAVALLDCTQPGVYAARRATYQHLAAIAKLKANQPPPVVPTVPQC